VVFSRRFFSRPLQRLPQARLTVLPHGEGIETQVQHWRDRLFIASNVALPAAGGTYEVIRLLPTDGDDCQYRIKSSIEAFERVATESQLNIS
jgi:hypothetical protein